MKSRFAVALSLFALLFGAGLAQAEVPHYFPPGLEQASAPYAQWEALLRMYNSTSLCRGSVGAGLVMRNFGYSEEATIAGKKTRLYFDAWSKSGDKILFYNFCGQEYITPAQFEVVKQSFVEAIRQSAEIDYKYYYEFVDLAIKSRAERLGVSEASFREKLGKPVPGAPKVTYRELEGIPADLQESDFIPKEIHLGYIQALGEVWLNSGTAFIALQAMMQDYIMGKPLVVMHEFVHANPKLQNLPFADGIDFELMASIPMMLLPEDKIAFVFHGYASTFREFAHVFFRFDSDQVRKEVLLWDHDGNLRIDSAKFDEYFNKTEAIKKEFMFVFRNALAEYYSDRIFWTAMADKAVDDRIVFRILMSMNYDPTILNGRVETAHFNETHTDEIKQMMDKAWHLSNTPDATMKQGMGQDGRLLYGSTLQELSALTGMSQEELVALANKYNLKPTDAENKTLPELAKIFLSFIQQENQERR